VPTCHDQGSKLSGLALVQFQETQDLQDSYGSLKCLKNNCLYIYEAVHLQQLHSESLPTVSTACGVVLRSTGSKHTYTKLVANVQVLEWDCHLHVTLLCDCPLCMLSRW